jgi:hypothetical protein
MIPLFQGFRAKKTKRPLAGSSLAKPGAKKNKVRKKPIGPFPLFEGKGLFGKIAPNRAHSP